MKNNEVIRILKNGEEIKNGENEDNFIRGDASILARQGSSVSMMENLKPLWKEKERRKSILKIRENYDFFEKGKLKNGRKLSLVNMFW